MFVKNASEVKKDSELIRLWTFLEQRLTTALPGAVAHEVMKARFVGNVKPNFNHLQPPRPGGVLILLYEQDGVVRFPLIKRPDYPGAHGGQISLPGGKTEPGEDMIQTALRETEEEIGVIQKEIHVLGTLSNFHVLPSNFIITPVVAVTEKLPQFIPDPTEVAGIITATVDELVHEQAIKEREITARGTFQMIAPHFEIEGEVVWGATAMMLNEFREVLRGVR